VRRVARSYPRVSIDGNVKQKNMKDITALLESNGNRSNFSARPPKAVIDYSNVNLGASIAIFMMSRVKIIFRGHI